MARFDRRLISQAVTNIVKNATEAFVANPGEELTTTPRIKVDVQADETMVTINVVDNGKGLPTENRARLLEPYVTTREKGTGLGLAIVGKIMEEHGGGIELDDAPGGQGAWIRLRLARDGGSSSPIISIGGNAAPAEQTI